MAVEYIGSTPIPEIIPDGTFPFVVDYPFGETTNNSLIVHRFESANRKIEQRYLVNMGLRSFEIRKNALNRQQRDVLKQFWNDHQGGYGVFHISLRQLDGTTKSILVRFADEPVNFENMISDITGIGLRLLEVPSSDDAVFTSAGDYDRLVDASVEAALAAQIQAYIPMLMMQPRQAGYDIFYFSDRRVTIDNVLFQPRLLNVEGISQTIADATDQAIFTLGDADLVLSKESMAVQFLDAFLDYRLYHINTNKIIKMWAGEVQWYSPTPDGKFIIKGADSLSSLTQMYPLRTVGSTCGKSFNSWSCPYATQGSLNPAFPMASATTCDKGFETPNGCQAHNMVRYFGGQPFRPQSVRILDNGTGKWGMNRNNITSVSISDESVMGQPIPEIYTDVPMTVNAKLISGREESDFYTALGIVGEGPIGHYSGDLSKHTLDTQPSHGPGLMGWRYSLGFDPANVEDKFVLSEKGATLPDQYAAGVAWAEIRRADTKGFQISRLSEHAMQVCVDAGLGGYFWDAPGDRKWNPTNTNPIWIAVNAALKASGLIAAPIAEQEKLFSVTSAVAAAAICADMVDKLIGTGQETQFKFLGVFSEQKAIRDWLSEVMNCCLGYLTNVSGKLHFGLRVNSSTVHAFTAGNIIADSLDLQPIDTAFNFLSVNFADPDFEFKNNSVTIYDIDHALLLGRGFGPQYRKGNMSLLGAGSKSQAARISVTRLREELGGLTPEEQKKARVARFRTTILALRCLPGDVISITHGKVPGGHGEFRVQSIRLNNDFSVDIEAKTTTDSMYDYTIGPKPADVEPDAVPSEPKYNLIPGMVIKIDGLDFVIDSVQLEGLNVRVQGHYNPPDPIGIFNGVVGYWERLSGSAAFSFAGEADYDGDPTAAIDSPARWGHFNFITTAPKNIQEWGLRLASKSRTYRVPVSINTPLQNFDVPAVGAPGEAVPPGPVTIDEIMYEYSDAQELWVRIYYTKPENCIGAHVFEERPDQSSSPSADMDGSISLDGTANLGSDWAPIDRGYFSVSPVVLQLDAPDYPLTERFYLNSYNFNAEGPLVQANKPFATPSITLQIEPPKWQSGEEYARLITDPEVYVDYDDTQVSAPKYRLRFKWKAPTNPPAVWQKPFGGVQIVYEYEDGSRANGPSFANNEIDNLSDWYDLVAGTSVVRCWFVSYDGTETPNLNTIIEGITPEASATVTWPLPTRPPATQYADNVTDFDVRNMRYDVMYTGQKILKIDAVWTKPTGDALTRWGGVTIWLHIGTERFQVTGLTDTVGITMEFPTLPRAHATWVFYAVSSDNNNNANTDGRNPIAGTPTDSIDVDPPSGGVGSEFTGNVTVAAGAFTSEQISASDGTTQQRIKATFTPPVNNALWDGLTWGGVEMRVYDQTGKLVGMTKGSKSPLVVDMPNPDSVTTMTVKLVSYDVNNKLNNEAANTPQGTVIIGAPTGTFDIRKYLPESTDLFKLDANNKIIVNVGQIYDAALMDGAVKASKIYAGAVTNPALGIDAVQAGNIMAGQVIQGKLATDAVIAANIAAGAVIAGKIGADAVTAVTVAANAITAGKIAALAVTAGTIAANAVTATEIAANAIVAGKIAANAVAAAQIAAGAITSDKLYSVEIMVGGGGGKPGQFSIYNASGGQSGWIGTNSGYSGAWFPTISIGGTSYPNGPLKADNSGNVTINMPFSSSTSYTILMSQTTYDATYTSAGVRVCSGGSPNAGSDTAWLVSRGLVVYGNSYNGSPGGGYYVVTANRRPDPNGNAGEVLVYGPNASTFIQLDGSSANVRALSYSVGSTPGVDGTFTTANGKTVTVNKGIITSIV